MNMPTPFGNKEEVQDTNHPFATVSESTVVVEETETKKKKNYSNTRRLTMEEQKYAIDNFAEKNPSTIAQEINMHASQSGKVTKEGRPLQDISASQIATTIRTTRKKVEEKIAKATEAGNTETANSLAVMLEEKLPKRSHEGTKGPSGSRNTSLDSIVDLIFTV